MNSGIMRRARAGFVALAIGLAAGSALGERAAAAAPPEIPTSAFAARSPFGEAKVSPDGNRIALVIDIDGKPNLAVIDAASKQFIERTAIDIADSSLEWFRWAGNERIVFSLAGVDRIHDAAVNYTSLYVTDLVTKKASYVVSQDPGLDGNDLLYVDPAGQYVLVQLQRDPVTEPEVRRFALDGSGDARGERVQAVKSHVWQWATDDAGVVRLGLGFANRKVKVLYRKSAAENFKQIAHFSGDAAGDKPALWDALRIVSGSDEGLTIADGPNGKLALRRLNYITGETGDVVYANKDWDVTDFDLDAHGRPAAAYFTDDEDRVAWLEPAMARIQQKLEKALPGKQLWISSRADDDSRMIVWAGSASDPGAYYLFTAASNTLERLAGLRPEIPADQLAPVEPVSYSARDGTLVHAYLTLPPGREPKGLPLIIVPHGGPYGVRDKLEYADEVQLLANRGYAVLQPNYRGSDGYGEAFEELGDGQVGRAMQDDLDDAMDWAVARGIADKGRVCVEGSSYGGYAALWAVIRNPERYRCAASFAGVTDWDKQLGFDANFFDRQGNKAWRARIKGDDKSFTLASVSPAEQASRLTRPILLAQGRLDDNVPFGQFKEMQDALEKAGFERAEYLTFDEEGHGFDTAEDEQKWYDALEAFLKKNNPPD